MVFIEFMPKHILDIPKLDEQHKNIYDLVNTLYNSKDKSTKVQLKNFSALLDAFKVHFKFEEKLMKESRAKNFISHKLEHDRAYNKYLMAFNNFEKGSTNLEEETLESIKSWLNAHFEKKDIKLKEILNKQ